MPDIDGDGLDDPAICFEVELINQTNQQTVGAATDCLSDLTPTGTGVALVGTSWFRLPQGALITRGLTSVQPVLQPTVTTWGQNMTHVTGASGTDNAIIGVRNVSLVQPEPPGFRALWTFQIDRGAAQTGPGREKFLPTRGSRASRARSVATLNFPGRPAVRAWTEADVLDKGGLNTKRSVPRHTGGCRRLTASRSRHGPVLLPRDIKVARCTVDCAICCF